MVHSIDISWKWCKNKSLKNTEAESLFMTFSGTSMASWGRICEFEFSLMTVLGPTASAYHVLNIMWSLWKINSKHLLKPHYLKTPLKLAPKSLSHTELTDCCSLCCEWLPYDYDCCSSYCGWLHYDYGCCSLLWVTTLCWWLLHFMLFVAPLTVVFHVVGGYIMAVVAHVVDGYIMFMAVVFHVVGGYHCCSSCCG